MSHYICAVLSKRPEDVENLLAPYNETDERYFDFEPLPEANFNHMQGLYHKDELSESISFAEWLEYNGYATDGEQIGFMVNLNTKWDYWNELKPEQHPHLYPLKTDEKLNIMNHPKVKQIDFSADETVPYCFVTPDGEWHEWFNMDEFCNPSACYAQPNMQAYKEEWEETKQSYPDAYLTYVDCHI